MNKINPNFTPPLSIRTGVHQLYSAILYRGFSCLKRLIIFEMSGTQFDRYKNVTLHSVLVCGVHDGLQAAIGRHLKVV
jgi:hypothetical protein